MSAFDLVIFDLDGVLVDSEVIACSCLAETLSGDGIAIDVEGVMRRFLGRGFSEVAAFYAAETGRPMEEAFRSAYRAQLAQRLRAALEPMPHAAELLARLARPFCLASSSDPERVALSLQLVGLAACFGGRVFTASMVARGKPAPDLFLHAAAAMGASPSRTLVLEDSVSGITGARAAGMTAWGFVGGSHCRRPEDRARLAAAGAHRILASLAEFDLAAAETLGA